MRRSSSGWQALESLAEFEKKVLEELGTEDQEVQWEENKTSGLIEKEMREQVTGVTGQKRTSEQLEQQITEYWYNPPQMERGFETSPESSQATKRSRSRFPEKEEELIDITFLRLHTPASCFGDVEMEERNKINKILYL